MFLVLLKFYYLIVCFFLKIDSFLCWNSPTFLLATISYIFLNILIMIILNYLWANVNIWIAYKYFSIIHIFNWILVIWSPLFYFFNIFTGIIIFG